jgi:E3 ubiquitin-protein ligase RBX1
MSVFITATCPICRNNFTDACIECEANFVDIKVTPCEITTGVCEHKFHQHCITRWLKLRSNCPMCNKPWEDGSEVRPTIFDDQDGEQA